jgi:very-short-patch-repair endonuclease
MWLWANCEDYWHQGCDPENRKAIFREFGYDTLIIWEHELQEIKNVKIKIQEFYERIPK